MVVDRHRSFPKSEGSVLASLRLLYTGAEARQPQSVGIERQI